MTEAEAQATMRTGELHIGGDIGTRVIPYACPGGFAVVAPATGQDALWYVLTDYHVNIFEDLEAVAAAPPLVRLCAPPPFPCTVRDRMVVEDRTFYHDGTPLFIMAPGGDLTVRRCLFVQVRGSVPQAGISWDADTQRHTFGGVIVSHPAAKMLRIEHCKFTQTEQLRKYP